MLCKVLSNCWLAILRFLSSIHLNLHNFAIFWSLEGLERSRCVLLLSVPRPSVLRHFSSKVIREILIICKKKISLIKTYDIWFFKRAGNEAAEILHIFFDLFCSEGFLENILSFLEFLCKSRHKRKFNNTTHIVSFL